MNSDPSTHKLLSSALWISRSLVLGFSSKARAIESISFQTFGWYAQDDFRVTPRLTLNLGLRYEFATDPNGPTHYADQNPLTRRFRKRLE